MLFSSEGRFKYIVYIFNNANSLRFEKIFFECSIVSSDDMAHTFYIILNYAQKGREKGKSSLTTIIILKLYHHDRYIIYVKMRQKQEETIDRSICLF